MQIGLPGHSDGRGIVFTGNFLTVCRSPLFTLIWSDRPSSVTRSAVYSRVGPLVAGPTLTLLADGSSPGGVAAYRLHADLKWEDGIQHLESALRRSCLHH